jgi:adenylate cyclase
VGVEIERKFLVVPERLPALHDGTPMRQGYLSKQTDLTVRVRLTPAAAFLTLKGPTRSISRAEFEYPIPRLDAEALLALCAGRVVEKVRHRVAVEKHVFEVDVFSGANTGLVVAEVELASEDEAFPRPDWLAAEVSHDRRYANSALAEHPYSDWSRS